MEMWRKRRLELRVGNWVNASENHYEIPFHTHCCCSVTQSFLTFCDPMDFSTPGFPVLHYLLEFAQTHVHWAGDNTQSLSSLTPFSSCPQIFPTSESFPVSWLLASGGKIIGASASVLPMNIQSWFFFFFYDCLVWSLAVQETLKGFLQYHS